MCSTRPSTFADDSWETIQTNVRSGNTSQYNVGDTRNVRIGNNEYTLRLANKTTISDCSNSSFSQTACGFVVEFVELLNNERERKIEADA